MRTARGRQRVGAPPARRRVRRRAEFEELCAPVRQWMLRELAPHEGDTVLELAAGVGETGFDAAVLIGERGRLISTELSRAVLKANSDRGL